MIRDSKKIDLIKKLQKKKKLSLKKFKFGPILGIGTFSTVKQVFYKKRNVHTCFALKSLNKSKIIELNQLEHLQQEKEILYQIQNPFIVELYKVFQDKNNVHFIFDFIQGGELFTRLRSVQKFSENVTLFYSSQILLAIEYLHQKDIVYRDIKPENIMIDQQGNVKLVDFGFAKKLSNGKRTLTICGTPEYLAPEILQNNKQGYNKSPDIWALGILIYEFLIGHPPFIDINPYSIYRKIVKGQYELQEFLSFEAKDFIKRILVKNPEIRLGVIDFQQLKFHEFFRRIDFFKVYQKQYNSPWIPQLQGHQDTKYFDQYEEEDCQNSIAINKSAFKFFKQFNKETFSKTDVFFGLIY